MTQFWRIVCNSCNICNSNWWITFLWRNLTQKYGSNSIRHTKYQYWAPLLWICFGCFDDVCHPARLCVPGTVIKIIIMKVGHTNHPHYADSLHEQIWRRWTKLFWVGWGQHNCKTWHWKDNELLHPGLYLNWEHNSQHSLPLGRALDRWIWKKMAHSKWIYVGRTF